VFAHGGGAPQWQNLPSTTPHPVDARRVRERWFSADGGLVTMAMALRGPQFATKETTLADFRLARELGLRITVHVGDGEWGRTRPVAWMRDQGLLGPDVTYVHCNTLADDELDLIAASGATASVSADIEMSMGHGWPATGRLLAVGVRPSLSIDVCTLNGGDMFGAMKSTLAAQRALNNADAAARGTVVEALVPSCRDVVEFATVAGAAAVGLADRVGTTSPGMFPLNNPYGAIVYSGHPGTVDTVLVRGRVVKRDGRLVGSDLDRVRRLAYASRDRLFERAAADPVIPAARPGGEWFPAPMTAVPPD
jgi:cytosine/adenosine deaminase-related metal-dependent hydrolase